MEILTLFGIHDSLIWFSWLIHTFLIGFIVITVITLILVTDLRGPYFANIRYTEKTVVWLLTLLFFFSQTIFCFTFCTIFKNALLATFSFCTVSLSLAYLAEKSYDFHNMVLVHLSCLFPAAAFIQAFRRITYYELLEIPLNWSLVFENERSAADASLAFVFVMLMFDGALYSILTFYIDSVNQGKKSPFFFLEYKVSGANKGITKATGTNADEEKYVDDEQSKLLFQDGPPGGEAILSFKNLHKRFGSIHAVNGINLNLYRNEILTLAGLEKSGKTTTLHLALGLIEPTEGTVTYKQSLNLLKSIDEHRSQLGFCPQENRLLPYFTILDHLVFYGMLRGEDELEATKKAISYLYLIGIAGNGNEYSSIITKEIERKTSIIIALIGNTEIVLLDEPVTGLELAAKQSIWNFLKKLKQTRTIFMTSTTMMDASLISDRIAVINNGIIVCSGSSEFLSKAFKVGYELKIRKSVVPTPIEPPTESSVGRPRRTKAPPKNGQTQTQVSLPRDTSNLIIQQIRRVFPGKRVIKSTKEIVINLPTFQTSKLPDLFKSLEDRKMELNIETIGVNCFTLENVFQKIGGETIFDIHGKPFKFSSIIQEALKITRVRHEKIKGIALLIDQHGILFKKKFLFVFRSWVLFLYRVVLPTLIMTVLIYGTYRFEEIDFPIELSLSSYPKSIIFLRENDYSNDIYDEVILFLTLSNTTFSITPNIDHNEVLLNYGRYNINTFRRDLLLALDLNIGDNQITVFYNKYARHSLPVGVNLFTNAMLKSYFDYSFEIITINHPISNVDVDKETDKFNTNVTDHSPVLTVWYIVLAFFTIDLLDYITIPIRDEHNSGFKHVQFLSGLSPLTYWINTLIFDFFLASLIVIFRVAIFHIFDAYGFFTFRIDLLVSATLVIVYIIAGLLFEYWISFIMPTKIGGLIVFKIVKFISKYLPSVGGNLSAGKLIAGTFISFTFYKLQTYLLGVARRGLSIGNVVSSIVKYLILLLPPVNFSLAYVKYIMGWRVNHIVTAYQKQGIDEEPEEIKHTPYLVFASKENPNGLLDELIFLIIDIILYSTLIYSTEYGYFGEYFIRQDNSTKKPDDTPAEGETIEESVHEEHIEVQYATSNGSKRMTNIILISDGLRKVYGKLFFPKRVAVNDATFLVQAGQCFGILGPKDSGKTTTLKLLTGEVTPDVGDSWILNTKLRDNRTRYFTKIGYCAQSDSFVQELTGKETLYLITVLRGVVSHNRNKIVEKWYTLLGLENIISEKCSSYSEGDRRKICAALALIGEPSVILLDEPVGRIDPMAKRSLYSAIGRIKSTGQAIVLSTRSVNECETLCDRFTIMIKGHMKFIGTTAELKTKYAQAMSLIVILNETTGSEYYEDSEKQMEAVKIAVTGIFEPGSCTVVDEYTTSLHFQINYIVPWSVAFTMMEKVKTDLICIKEYLLSQKSVDEILTTFSVES